MPKTEPNLELFFSNYELRVVDTAEVAGRTGLVVELYHRSDNRLVVKYFVDFETGLALNQYQYDPNGSVSAYEVIRFQKDIRL